MANPSLQIGNGKFAIKENDLLGYSSSGTRFFPIPITMTRATLGSRVNPSGLVENVELLGSDIVFNGDFATDLSGWSGQAGRGSYAWDNGRAKITNDDASSYPNLSQSITTEIGKVYKITATVEIGTATLIEVRAYSNSNIGSKQLTKDGTIEFYITADDTDFTLHLYLFETGNTGHYCYFDNVSVKEATIDGLARVDYSDGTASLLVEPQRTNLVINSNSSLNPNNTSISYNDITSPDGTQNGFKIQSTSTGTAVYVKTDSISFTDATFSVFVKYGNTQWLQFLTTNTGAHFFNFDVQNGVFGTNGVSTSNLKATEFDNGWYRVSGNFTGGSGVGDFRVYLSNASNAAYGASTSTSGDFLYSFGWQVEAGSYATSYIKTQGSSVTRNKDQYEKTGISDKINSEEGVLFVEMAALSNDLTYRILSLSNGTPNERVYIQYTNVSNTISAVVKNGGSTQFNKTYVLSDETAFSKIAVKWKLNDFAIWVDGVERATDTSGNPPSGLNRLAFDNADITDFFGKVKQLQVFKTALSDSELATLTT
ncbi:MAG: hypothetical protein P8H37_11095 [Paracoccaceae bacterium]|nr:hypothetical protein [Paracoccaceae bacterium]